MLRTQVFPDDFQNPTLKTKIKNVVFPLLFGDFALLRTKNNAIKSFALEFYFLGFVIFNEYT